MRFDLGDVGVVADALDRAAVLDGEIWRLWTGHLVHGSPYHLAWDVAALVGLGLLFERALGRHFTRLVLVGGAFVGGGVLALQPGVETYLGLSGVLNTIWVGGAVLAARGERARRSACLNMPSARRASP